jgi:hypothetical protein
MGIANIENHKMELISFIITLQQEDAIAAFERVVPRIKKKVKSTNRKQDVDSVDLAYFARPVRENITIEELMQEQHNFPIDKTKMDAIVKSLDIQEPIEELLLQLKD